MNFFLIKELDGGDNIAGVLLESEEGTLGGRLSGDNGVNDPARVVPFLMDRMPENGYPVTKMRGKSRVVNYYRPGQPGFVDALMQNLQPPLRYYLKGRVTEEAIDVPEVMTQRLWRMFTTDEEVRDNPPPYKRL